MKKSKLASVFIMLSLICMPAQSESLENSSNEINELLEFKFIKLVESPEKGYSGVFLVSNNNSKDLYGLSMKVNFYEGEKYIRWTSYSQFGTAKPTIKGGETKELTILDGIASSINRIEVQVTSVIFK